MAIFQAVTGVSFSHDQSHASRGAHPSQGQGRAQIVVERKPELPFEIVRGSRGGAEVSSAVPPALLWNLTAATEAGPKEAPSDASAVSS